MPTAGFVGCWQGWIIDIHPSLPLLFEGLHTCESADADAAACGEADIAINHGSMAAREGGEREGAEMR